MPVLEIIVFLCGASTMILELVGSRVLAPYLGTSIIVWTSLIGIILGFLSVGYWWGGKLSDQKPEAGVFSGLLLAAALSVGAVSLASTPILILIQNHILDYRVGTVLAAVVLFGVPSVFLGTVLPYAIRLKVTSVQESGQMTGRLCALSTVGSIVGTFLAGFVLISHFGNRSILIFLSVVLLATSALARGRTGLKRKAAILAGLLIAGGAAARAESVILGPDFVDVNTLYNRVWIYDSVRGKRPIRMMQLNDESSSAAYLDGDELVFEYCKYYRLAGHFNPSIRRALLLGGAAYSYPKDFLSKHPEARMDVVEIDPGLTALARKYFGLKDDPRLGVIHEDGRTFLNRNRQTYDAIYVDVFKSIYSLPHQLATREAVERMDASLAEGGVVLVNMIASVEGETGKALRAQVATYKSVFPQVYVFPITYPEDGRRLQNVMLIALKSAKMPAFFSTDRELNAYLNHLWLKPVAADVPVLTDDFAPVEKYVMGMLSGKRPRINPAGERAGRYFLRRGK